MQDGNQHLTLRCQSLAGSDHDRRKRPHATRTSGEAGGFGGTWEASPGVTTDLRRFSHHFGSSK
jgi:hypothetical protein